MKEYITYLNNIFNDLFLLDNKNDEKKAKKIIEKANL